MDKNTTPSHHSLYLACGTSSRPSASMPSALTLALIRQLAHASSYNGQLPKTLGLFIAN